MAFDLVAFGSFGDKVLAGSVPGFGALGGSLSPQKFIRLSFTGASGDLLGLRAFF